MIAVVGAVVVMVMVFGGYLAAGGKLGIIISALPFEMIIIGGGAVGAFLISNDGATAKKALRDLGKVVKGPRWRAEDYRDLLCLLFELVRLARQNPVELEEHIEAPDTSDVFARYPRILADREAVELIADTLRSASMNYDDPHQVEAVLEKRIEASRHKMLKTSEALQTVADGLPALGIVAAVLGVIKTMASIDKPPEVLGGLIGAALVGTFLGVFLAYCFVGPASARLRTIAEDDAHFYELICEVLVANLHEHPVAICIEVGRQNTPNAQRPSYSDLEAALKDVKDRAA